MPFDAPGHPMGCLIATDRLIGSKRGIEHARRANRPAAVDAEGQDDRVGAFFNGAFSCDDVQYAYEKLMKRGVEFLAPPDTKPFPHVYFKDPDVNTFFLSSR